MLKIKQLQINYECSVCFIFSPGKRNNNNIMFKGSLLIKTLYFYSVNKLSVWIYPSISRSKEYILDLREVQVERQVDPQCNEEYKINLYKVWKMQSIQEINFISDILMHLKNLYIKVINGKILTPIEYRIWNSNLNL